VFFFLLEAFPQALFTSLFLLWDFFLCLNAFYTYRYLLFPIRYDAVGRWSLLLYVQLLCHGFVRVFSTAEKELCLQEGVSRLV